MWVGELGRWEESASGWDEPELAARVHDFREKVGVRVDPRAVLRKEQLIYTVYGGPGAPTVRTSRFI